MNPNPVADYMADVIDRAIERQPERSLQPPELPEPSAQARKDAADAFDAGDDLAQDWLADHWRDAEARAFGMAAFEYGSRVFRDYPKPTLTNGHHYEVLMRVAYEALRAAFVDQMAGEYE